MSPVSIDHSQSFTLATRSITTLNYKQHGPSEIYRCCLASLTFCQSVMNKPEVHYSICPFSNVIEINVQVAVHTA